MKILLASVGTRGDIDPFLALGQLLAQRGHEVGYAFPDRFAELVPQGQAYYPLSSGTLGLIEGPDGRTLMGKASLWRKAGALKRLYTLGKQENGTLVQQLSAATAAYQPHRLVHNSKCSYAFLWSLATGKTTILLSLVPYFMYPDSSHPHVGINLKLGAWFNRLTYRMANAGLVHSIYSAQQHLGEAYRFSQGHIKKALASTKLVYTISPSLYAPKAEWPLHVQVLGYHQRSPNKEYIPSSELQAFLARHERVLLLTFGSMVSNRPAEVSKILYDALAELGIPAVVNTAAGGLVPLEPYTHHPGLCFTETVPYHWLMPRVQAVVHHGGSGTTHTVLMYGLPTLILPHILDQHAWKDLVATLGLGPKGVPVHKLNQATAQALLADVWNNASYRTAAAQQAQTMQAEQLDEAVCQYLVS